MLRRLQHSRRLGRSGPDNGYDYEDRWPGVLAHSLGTDWLVLEEGLNGRTTVRDDPVEGAFRNGKSYLLPCLYSHMPLDLVAIMPGTNDLKARFNASPWDIGQGVATLIGLIRSAAVGRGGQSPEILIIAPPPILDTLTPCRCMRKFSWERSRNRYSSPGNMPRWREAWLRISSTPGPWQGQVSPMGFISTRRLIGRSAWRSPG